MGGNISDNANVTFNQTSASSFNSSISGTGTLTLGATANLALSGANTFTGNTNLNTGTLILGNGLALQNSTLNYTGGTLNFGNLTLASFGGLSGNKDLALANAGSAAVVLTVGANNHGTTYGGNLSGAGSLTKTGTGSLTLSGTNTFTGGVAVTAGTLTLAGGTAALGGNISDNATLIFNQAVDTTLSGVFSGNGSLIKQGAGTLTLTAASNFSGITTLSAGTLTFTADTSGFAGNITNNASLIFKAPGDSSFGKIISGAGSVTLSTPNNLTFSGTNSYSGNTTINLGTLIFTGGTMALTGNILDDSALIFNQSANNTYGGVISGNGSVTQSGNSTLTLSSNNIYTGGTTVAGGALLVSNDGTVSATGSGMVNVAANATLAGSGSVAGNTTVNGTLSPGSGNVAGLLTFAQNLTLGANATVNFLLGGSTRGALYAAVTVGGNLSLGGTLALSLINSFIPAVGATFDLFQAPGSFSGILASLTLPVINSNLTWNTTQLDTSGDIAVQTVTFSQWTSALSLSGNNALPAAKPFGSPANLIRYAMNLDSSPAPSGAPTLSAEASVLIIQYQVRKNMSDYQLVPQYSTDLATWTNVDSGNITQRSDANIYTSNYQASANIPANGSVFLRVVAEPLP